MRAPRPVVIALVLIARTTVGCGGGGSPGSSPDGAPRVPDALHAPDGAGAPDAPPAPVLELGVSFSPRGFATHMTAQDVTDFYAGHAAYGRLVAYHTSWRDSPAQAGQIPAIAVEAMARAPMSQFTPVIGFGWDGATGPELDSAADPTNDSWTNAQTRAQFQSMVVAFATQYHPPYLFLGNEVNTYYLAHTPAEWAAWVSEYEACYAAIKAASPQTIVYMTFQYEHLIGVGRKNGWTDPDQWAIVADVAPHLDAIGFTTYPYFEHETPADVPADYYAAISAHFAGPVIFSELGWLTDGAAPYTGSEAEQHDFLGVFFDRTSALPLRAAVYVFEHDVDVLTTGPFAGIGLRTNDGTPRTADAAWQALVVARQTP